MGKTLLLLFIAINFGCTNKSLPQKLIPTEYNFPENQIGTGKTMVYLNDNTGDTTYLNLFHNNSNQKTFLIQFSYDKNSTSDSMIFLNQKLIDYYINPTNDGKLWKANQISDTIITDRDGKFNEVSEVYWQKNSNHVSVKNQTWVIKDTTLQWNGKFYSTIITKNIVETNSNFLRTPDGKYNFKMEVTNYVSKYIGTVRRIIICSWRDTPIITNLIDIRDMQINNSSQQKVFAIAGGDGILRQQ